jgi:5-oxoprolinase (ATP-hydrolysing)
MGRNLWVKHAEKRNINIGGKGTMNFGAGDTLVLETPGGGGWGTPNQLEVGNGSVPPMPMGGQGCGWEARGSIADRARVDF